MWEKGLHLMAFPLIVEELRQITVYGFKMSESLVDLLKMLSEKEESDEEKISRMAGRGLLKAASALYPDDVIHFHGNLSTSLNNSEFWFYSLKPINLTRLNDYVKEWFRIEGVKHNIKIESLMHSEWGEFQPITLDKLLEFKSFNNGRSIIEKWFLSQLADKDFPFVAGAPKLTFRRVLSENGSQIMSEPYFKEGFTPYSYVLRADIRLIPGTTEFLLMFKPSVRLWVAEAPLSNKDRYFSSTLNTNTYFNYISRFKPKSVVFNQIPLCRTRDLKDISIVQEADRFFTNQFSIDLIDYLEKELIKFSSDKNTLLTTIPNTGRTDSQVVNGEELAVPLYGVGLEEKSIIFQFIKEELKVYGLNSISTLQKLTEKGTTVTRLQQTKEALTREEGYPLFGLEGFLLSEEERLQEEEKRLAQYQKAMQEYLNGERKSEPKLKNPAKFIRPKSPFMHPEKESISIGIFSKDEWIRQGLMGHIRSCLDARIETDLPYTYQDEKGLKVSFTLFEETISQEIKTAKDKNQCFKLISSLVKQHSMDGCFIECENLKDRDEDPKHFLRTQFANLGIQTQFITPNNFLDLKKMKSDVLNRTNSCATALLGKLNFVEAHLLKLLSNNQVAIGVSKIILRYNNFYNAIPCLTKVEAGQTFIKLYPYKEWCNLDEVLKLFGRDFVKNLEQDWVMDVEFQRFKNTQWLTSELKEMDTSKEVIIFWDDRVESVLEPFNLSKIDDYFKELLPDNFTNGVLVRWTHHTKTSGYLNATKDNELGKGKGVFASGYHEKIYFLIGERPQNQAKNEVNKWSEPDKQLIVPGLNQVYFYGGDDSIDCLKYALLTQRLRKVILTFEIEASVPYPLFIPTFIEELIESFFIEYGKKKSKKKAIKA